MTIDEAVNLMRGKPGTSIELTLVREGENKPIVVPIVRDIIKIESVYSRVIENENVLYVRVVSLIKISLVVSKKPFKSIKMSELFWIYAIIQEGFSIKL